MQNSTPPKRSSAWPRAIGAAGLGLAAVVGGAWLVRAPLADAALRLALADRDIAGDWRIVRLDATRIELAEVRLGDSQAPDLKTELASIRWRWTLFGPRIDEVALTRPVVAVGLDRNGLDLGELAKFGGGPKDQATKLPDLSLSIIDGQIALATPAGLAHGHVQAAGRLGATFKAELALSAPGAAIGASPALTGSLTAPASGPQLALSGRLETLTWEGIELHAVDVQGAAKAPRDLSSAEIRFLAAAAAIDLGGVDIRYASGEGQISVSRFGPGLRPDAWRGTGAIAAQTVAAAAAGAADLALNWDAAGDSTRAEGSWRLAADRAAAADAVAAVAGAGAFRLAADLNLDADGAMAITPPKTGPPMRIELPPFAGAPLQPLLAEASPNLNRALGDFQAQAPVRITWRKDHGRFDLVGPLTATARSRAQFAAEPTTKAALFSLTLPDGSISGGGRVAFGDGGLPNITAQIAPFAFGADRREFAAQFTVQNWRANGAALDVRAGQFNLDGANPDAAFRIRGDVTVTGPLAGATVRNARTTVDLVGTLGKTFRIGPAARGLRLQFDGLDLANLRFGPSDLTLSADSSGAFARRGPDGKLSGGASTSPLRLTGATLDGLPARLEVGSLAGGLSGTAAAIGFSGQAQDVRFALDLADGRTVNLAAATTPFSAAFDAKGWQIDGKALAGAIADPSLPAHIDDLAIDWRLRPSGEAVQITIANGTGRVRDKEAKPRFNPLRLSAVAGELVNGVFTSNGAITLQTNGVALARFSGQHDLEAGAGGAQVLVRDLSFSPSLELFELTELARGVVENVRGPIDGDFEARWSATALQVDGALVLKDVSAATAGLGPISGVSGKIVFNDLALLTTPPGQRLTVASLNPGIEVRNGEIGFQLRPNGVVALESAVFPFAKGKLSVEPTEVTIGALESRYTLLLQDVDVAAFIEEMKFKDLTATGTIEGAFPLVITPNRAFIENGRITAGRNGGLIQYTGAAGKAAGGGVGQIAFQALQGFRYDQLEIDINGPLDSEVVANLRFRGVNVAPVDIAPGLGPVARADGLPFRFNVSVSAPFRALAESANRAANPLDLLRAAQPLPPPPQ